MQIGAEGKSRSINKFQEGLLGMGTGTQIVADVKKEDVLQLYDELCPTPDRVLSLIRADVDGL